MEASVCFFIFLLCRDLTLVTMKAEENGFFIIQTGQVPTKSCILDEFTVENTSSPVIGCGVECNKNQYCVGMDLISDGTNVCRLLSGFVSIVPSMSAVGQCTRYQKSNGEPKGRDFYCSITLMNGASVATLCHQDTYIWTIIQRRLDGSVNFKQNWAEYRTGFGTRDSEFWIGNENIHQLTNEGYTHLRIELMDHDCVWKYAEYSSFYTEGEGTKYRLHVSGYSGDAGDSFLYHNNMYFSTSDNDNDKMPAFNCAQNRLGGWWYNFCHEANLNGEYSNTDYSNGINWNAWRGFYYSMKEVRMMIRK